MNAAEPFCRAQAGSENLPIIPALQEVLTGEMAQRHGPLPIVPLPAENRLLVSFVSELASSLKGKGIFRRDRAAIVIPDHEKRRLVSLSPEAFRSWSQKHVVTSRTKHDRDGIPYVVYRDMSPALAKAFLQSPLALPHIDEIKEVHPVPLPCGNGSALLSPGYTDGIYTFSFTQQGSAAEETPYYDWTLEESVRYLRWLLSEFPFGEWVDVPANDDAGAAGQVRNSRSLAVQVAAMLSLFCKAMTPLGANRMGFVYTANSQRSGKSLLAKLAIMPITGGFKGQSWKSREEELNKVVDAEMIAGSTCICFDNVRGFVGSPAVEGLMTSPSWTGRVLNTSEMFEVENRATLFITGNDCTLSPDLAHRCLVVDLHINEGNVQDRRPSWVLDESWLLERENKKRILSALWGIVRNWAQSGCPTASSFGLKPRLGFEKWGELIGGIVAFAGFGNCLEDPRSDVGGNSEERNLLNLIDYLIAKVIDNGKQFTFQDVSQICYEEGLFEWMLEGREYDGVYTVTPKCRSTLGRLLGRYAPNVDGNKAPRRYIRSGKPYLFSTRGQGRSRRYFVEEAD